MRRSFLVVAGFSLVVAGAAWAAWTDGDTVEPDDQMTFAGSRLTSPWLEPRRAPAGPRTLRVALLAVEALTDAHPSVDAAVRVRDLTTQASMSVNDHLHFAAASMTKLGILICVLARAEDDPGVLRRELTFPGPGAMGSRDSMLGFPDEYRMTPGTTYTVEELLLRMVAYSDNHAMELLRADIPPAELDALLTSWGAARDGGDGILEITSATYGGVLRVLYNSTFLSRAKSEYALDLLSRNVFNGLARDLPSGTTVASKFGLYSDGEGVQVHECGIVYKPDRPYQICVLLRSESDGQDALVDLLATISRTVWDTL